MVNEVFAVVSAITISSPLAGIPGDQLAALFQLTLAVPFQVETAAFTVVLATNASAAATFSIMGVRFFIVLRRLFGLGDWFRDFNNSSWRLFRAKDWQPFSRGGSMNWPSTRRPMFHTLRM
jgi:hypothetical protein